MLINQQAGNKCSNCGGWIQVAYYRGETPKMCNCSNSSYSFPKDFVEIKEIGFMEGLNFHIKETLANGITINKCNCWNCYES